MANYSTLKAAVADVVKTNGTRAITGANLQAVLLSIINSVGGGGYIFKGVATPSTDAGTPDENVFYIGGAGTYANFGTSVTVPVGSIGVFKYNGSWTNTLIKLYESIDDIPKANTIIANGSGGIRKTFDLVAGRIYCIRFLSDWATDQTSGTNKMSISYSTDGTNFVDIKTLVLGSAPLPSYIITAIEAKCYGVWVRGNAGAEVKFIVTDITDLKNKTEDWAYISGSKGISVAVFSGGATKQITFPQGETLTVYSSQNNLSYSKALTSSDIYTLYNYRGLFYNIKTNVFEFGTPSDENEFWIPLLLFSGEAVSGILAPYYYDAIFGRKDVLSAVTEKVNAIPQPLALGGSVSGNLTIPQTNANTGWAVEGIDLLKGHKYEIVFTPSASVSATLITTKIGKSDGSTLVTLGFPANNSSWSSAVTYTYIPTEDVLSAKLGSWYQGASSSITETVTIKDLTVQGEASISDAGNIVEHYKHKDLLIKNILSSSQFSTCDIKGVFFTDVHASANNVNRVVELANYLGLDVILNGGDTVADNMSDGLTWYNSIINDCNIPLLACPGNHDCVTQNGYYVDGGVVKWYWEENTDNIYNLVIAPIAAKYSITQPSSPVGKCYYYKDFGNVRVISILSMTTTTANIDYFDATQKAWFESVLADAITNSKSVICINHAPFSTATRPNTKWNSYANYLVSPSYDDLRLSSEAVACVDTFVNNGGDFICWFAGHTHTDNCVLISTSGNQYMFDSASARYNYTNDGYRSGDMSKADYDCFTIFGVDTANKFLKFYRVGYNSDARGTIKETLCIYYPNGNIMIE